MSDNVKHFYEFEEFRLDAETPSLWRGGQLVPIFPKALEILVLLVGRRGAVVSREELLETVWHNTFVEESNITYTVSLLRKTLDNPDKGHFVQTIPKRGYRFVADVREVSENGKTNIENVPRRDYHFAVSADASPKFETNGAIKTSAASQIRVLRATGNGLEASHAHEMESRGGKPANREASVVRHSSTILSFTVGAILLALVGFAGFFIWSTQTGKQSLEPFESVNFQKLTFTGDLTFPVLAPDGNSFAFVRRGALFIQDVASGDEIRLNVEGEKVFGILQFSPDGSSLYFRNRVSFDLAASVFQVSRFGGRARLVAENVWSGFGFSPDGKQMAFVRVNPNEAVNSLIVKNLETGAERKLATLNLPSEFLDNGHPAWSPDGQKIAIVIFKKLQQASASQLIVVDTESGKIEEINTPQLRQFEQAAWLPGGRDLIISAREDGKFFQLWRLSYPGGEVQKITNDLNIYRGISLSNDGKKLLARQFTLFSHLWIGEKSDLGNARQKTFGNLNRDGTAGINWMPNGDILYAARIMGDADLWLYRPADDSRRQLTKNAGSLHINPAASADGRYIFFNTNRSGANHIWRMDASGANQMQITFGEKQVELYPQISPDGAWLYYLQKGAMASTVWRKSLTDDRAEALTEVGKLAPDSFLSLSPDGKFLAFHNAIEKVNEDAEKQVYQIGVIPTDKPQAPKFFSIAASRLVVRWTSDGTALDYVENNAEGARIWRQSVEGDQSPTLVVNLPKAFLHNFAWSSDGEKLALSQGQQSNDAILLTNFQP